MDEGKRGDAVKSGGADALSSLEQQLQLAVQRGGRSGPALLGIVAVLRDHFCHNALSECACTRADPCFHTKGLDQGTQERDHDLVHNLNDMGQQSLHSVGASKGKSSTHT